MSTFSGQSTQEKRVVGKAGDRVYVSNLNGKGLSRSLSTAKLVLAYTWDGRPERINEKLPVGGKHNGGILMGQIKNLEHHVRNLEQRIEDLERAIGRVYGRDPVAYSESSRN